MLKYKITQATSKEGINFIKGIIKSNQHKFIKIHNEDDIGLDCLIQLIDNDKYDRIIALQVKSGNSFYNPIRNSCTISIDNHREYWRNIELPVYGVVYVPKLWKAFWCDIKKELDEDTLTKQISFLASNENEFNDVNLMSFIENKKRPTEYYISIITKFANKNTSVNFLINRLSTTISEIVPLLMNFNDVNNLVSKVGWKIISEKDFIVLKKNSRFAIVHTQELEIKFESKKQLIYLDENSEKLLNYRFTLLKNILNSNE